MSVHKLKLDLSINQRKIRFILVLAALVVRIVFGFMYQPWMQSNDQIAWQLVIDHHHFSYSDLIHYPHEGGSLFIGFLAWLITGTGIPNSLIIIGLLLFFTISLIQISVLAKVFNAQIANYYGFALIIASPTLIPWGTMTFGLHALSSLFPFLMLYQFHLAQNDRKSGLMNGLLLGVACWFSYINIVLVIAFLGLVLADKRRRSIIHYTFLSLVIVLLLHFGLRMIVDEEFHLLSGGLNSVRGETFTGHILGKIPQIFKAGFGSLPASAVSVNGIQFGYFPLMISWLIVMLSGAFFAVVRVKGSKNSNVLFILITGLVFIIIYGLSPFYSYSSAPQNFLFYRHFAYILPFFIALTLVGWTTLNIGKWAIFFFFGIGVYLTFILFTQPIESKTREKEAGWTLGQKFGDQPKRLFALINESSYNRKLLAEGAAWGISSALFDGVQSVEDERYERGVVILQNFVDTFEPEARSALKDGINYAFGTTVTPSLNPTILSPLMVEINFSSP